MRISRSWPVQSMVGLLVLAFALPAPVLATGLSLGTARGVRAAELSIDGGGRWLAVSGRSLPVLDGAAVRSTAGSVVLRLTDGSRLDLLPYSAARVREVGNRIEVALDYGRLSFRLPASTRVVVKTASARLEPARPERVAGEVVANETTAVKMATGRMQVHSTVAGELALVASLDPVFVPTRPQGSGPLFSSDLMERGAPAGARGLFGPRGQSLGYLHPDGRFVVQPGFTADLTSPFAPRTVQVALAQIPDADRAAAEPLFDVNGGYVGYVSGPRFFAQAQSAPVSTSGAAAVGGSSVLSGVLVTVGALAITAGAGLAVSAATDSDDRPATPTGP